MQKTSSLNEKWDKTRLRTVSSAIVSTMTVSTMSGVVYLAPVATNVAQAAVVTSASIHDGDTIRVSGTNDVYIVKLVGAKTFKRLVLNPSIFNSYGQLSWSKVKEVSQATMDGYNNTNLVQHVNAAGVVVDTKVWSVTSAANSDTGAKKWMNITGAQFSAAGLDWDSIYKINDIEAADTFYPTGADVTSTDNLVAWGTNVNGGSSSVVAAPAPTVPIASPAAGTYTSTQNVTLGASGASSIRYTLDNSTPTCISGQIYSGAIAIALSKTLKAISCYSSDQSSSIVSYSYAINLTVSASQISSLLNINALTLPTGATYTSTPSLQAAQQIVIQTSATTGTSTITLPIHTKITSVSGLNFDATAITASSPDVSTLSGLPTGAVIDGSLQWGIVSLGLQFSNPITIGISVSGSLNGQTLNIARSTSGTSGWTADGIVATSACIVSNGLCAFSTMKASYYSVYHIVASTGGGAGGGGGAAAEGTNKT